MPFAHILHAWRRNEAPNHGVGVVDFEGGVLLIDLDALNVLLFYLGPRSTGCRCPVLHAGFQDVPELGLHPWTD